ncbi:efflux RND transporter periplasmic adaptor subunit [Parahalioglobus pacificus]|uniref:RND transporter n=1 Tax=Parahalioglobus pacificus TaxID=930806 RepID=A0A918XLT9_9GAMM|nr:efflux RND transporter periplasmic adaptor subunit [Halioglobus pacificus]GHD36660.1 RND transporter [Halioglobus pacificus]
MTPKWRKHWFRATAVVLIGGAVAYGILTGKPTPEPQVAPALAPPTVDVLVAQPSPQALSVETQGSVEPLREINLVSQVAGLVVGRAPAFEVGGFFQAEEALVQIEQADYEFAMARAESQVASARQVLAEERGRARQAQREWRDLGTDEANDLFLRKPQIAAAEASLRAAQADLSSARLNLSRTAISAPFNGRISEKMVDEGQYVAPGTVIARAYATDVAQVRLPLTDRQVTLLDLPLSYDNSGDQGQASQVPMVTLNAQFAGRLWTWKGRIVRTDASIDLNSRVVYAVAEVLRPFAKEEGSERPPLAPGLFVSATISGREIPDVVTLPRNALRTDGSVMVVDAQQRAQARPVDVLQSDGRQMWVTGISAGERVVVSDPTVAVAGAPVTVNANEVAGGAN